MRARKVIHYATDGFDIESVNIGDIVIGDLNDGDAAIVFLRGGKYFCVVADAYGVRLEERRVFVK